MYALPILLNMIIHTFHNSPFKLDYFFYHQIDAMEKDSLETSHPINTEVNNPAEIGYIFDAISYEKVN